VKYGKSLEKFQLNYSKTIKAVTNLTAIGGGLIYTSEIAEEVLQNNRADLVYLGRVLLRNPYWPLNAAAVLNDEIT